MTKMNSNEETSKLASAEDRLENSVGNWIRSLESFEELVDGMKKNQLIRAIKAAYAAPLEHDRIPLSSNEEAKLLQMFSQRDVDKLNASLAHMEIEGEKLKQQSENKEETNG